ncbi:MAG: DUF4097 family beta strand repeat-containing protein [Sphingobacteriales bacterium]
MKTYFLLFFLALSSLAVLAQDNEKTPYLTKSLSNDAISSVVVKTSAGGISVSGESGQQPRIEVYIQGNNGNRELSKEEIKRRLDENYDMSIAVDGHELKAIVKTKHDNMDWDKDGLSISFKIYVPENVSTDLSTSGGGIHLSILKGNEKFTTSGGGLDLNKLNGIIRGNTSGGGIHVSDSGNDIDLHTSGGGITAKNCNGTIKLETSGGGLDLENLKGTINAHTSGGGVRGGNIEGELVTSTSGGGIDLKNMDCSLSASTSAGSLRAEMKHVGKYLKLDANSGNIDLDLPLKQGLSLNITADRINQHPLNISDFTGDWDKNHIKGTINGGGIPVSADASSGNINVKFN